MMRSKALLFPLLITLLLITGCASPPGNTADVTIDLQPSTSFSQEEVEAAATVILEKFADFHDCTLTELSYSDADNESQGNAPGTITFSSSFNTGPSVMNQGLNPDDTYTNWSWILERTDESAPWVLVNYGLG